RDLTAPIRRPGGLLSVQRVPSARRTGGRARPASAGGRRLVYFRLAPAGGGLLRWAPATKGRPRTRRGQMAVPQRRRGRTGNGGLRRLRRRLRRANPTTAGRRLRQRRRRRPEHDRRGLSPLGRRPRARARDAAQTEPAKAVSQCVAPVSVRPGTLAPAPDRPQGGLARRNG